MRAPHSRRATALALGLTLGLALGLAGCGGEEPAERASAPATTIARAEPAVHVRVRVVDGDTGEPVSGASVTGGGAPGGPVEVEADASGEAGLPEGVSTVVVRAPRYGTKQVPVGDGERLTVELYRPALQSPAYGGGPERTRVVPAVTAGPPETGQRPNWIFDAITLIEFPPAVRNGLAVFGVNSGRVFALDADTGEIVWETRQGGPIAASPAFHEDMVLMPSMDGVLHAYRAATGQELWTYSTGGSPIESSPLVVGGRAFIGTWDGRLHAVDVATGELDWAFQAPADIKGSAVRAGDLVVVGDYAGRVHALDPETGEEVWTYTGGARFYGGPGYADGMVVIGDVGGAVIGLDAQTGAERWRVGTGGYVYGSPAIADGRVFIGSYDQLLRAIDLQTGAVEWTFDAGGRISGSATVVDGVVYTAILYAPGQPRATYGLDVRDGSVVFEHDDGRYSPAVGAGDTLFLVGTRLLYAFHEGGPDGPTVERAAEIS